MLRRPRSRQARPRLEALEDRCCPAVVLEGRTLHIGGSDRVDDKVHLYQDDIHNIVLGNYLAVDLNGSITLYQSSAVSHLDVQLGGGNDVFAWDLSGKQFRYAKTADINLGDGNNSAEFYFNNHNKQLTADLAITVTGGGQRDEVIASFGRVANADVAFTANLGEDNDDAYVELRGDLINAYFQVTLNGGDGDDVLKAFNYYGGDHGAVHIDASSTFGVVLNGDNGNDTLHVYFTGVMEGLMVLRLDGGADNDQVFAGVYMQGGSDGGFDARLLGGDGGDDLYLTLREEPGSSIDILDALLDGGAGLGLDFCDWGKTTPNVTVVNCI